MVVCIAACVVVAWLLNLTIEKLFMKIRGRMIGQKGKHIANTIKVELETINR